jgi:hypothetical protein
MANPTFVSRRDNAFREYPPASAQTALVIPFFGDCMVWVRKAEGRGWEFPSSQRRSGETILEVARRELWDSARLIASKLDLLGAVRHEGPRSTTSYVYMCDVHNLPWGYEIPTEVAELGLFTKAPRPVAAEWSEVVLEAALRARRTGLR